MRYFNPRSGERSDEVVHLKLTDIVNFNPRSGERSDIEVLIDGVYSKISIHAPANGATVCI